MNNLFSGTDLFEPKDLFFPKLLATNVECLYCEVYAGWANSGVFTRLRLAALHAASAVQRLQPNEPFFGCIGGHEIPSDRYPDSKNASLIVSEIYVFEEDYVIVRSYHFFHEVLV